MNRASRSFLLSYVSWAARKLLVALILIKSIYCMVFH